MLRKGAGRFLALFLATGPIPVAAHRVEPAPAILASPGGNWGPLAVAVVMLEPSRKKAPGYSCPPAESPDDLCVGENMFDHRGRIDRLLMATSDFGSARRGVFRAIAGHAVGAAGGGRFIAVLERTHSGHTWVSWYGPVLRDRACIPAGIVAKIGLTSIPPGPNDAGSADRCFAL
jgi:hypothetical protein